MAAGGGSTLSNPPAAGLTLHTRSLFGGRFFGTRAMTRPTDQEIAELLEVAAECRLFDKQCFAGSNAVTHDELGVKLLTMAKQLRAEQGTEVEVK